MVIDFRTRFGCATLICFFICTGFLKISALRCYFCIGKLACETKHLGKNGSAGEGRHFIDECNLDESYYKGSEYCVTSPGRDGVSFRGCVGVTRDKKWDPSNRKTGCPVLAREDQFRHEGYCVCYHDLCNGDPIGCCQPDV